MEQGQDRVRPRRTRACSSVWCARGRCVLSCALFFPVGAVLTCTSLQVAAPRYASHLSGCMGLTGSRRGAERRAAAANGKASGANRCCLTFASAKGVHSRRLCSRTGSVASSHGSDTDSGGSSRLISLGSWSKRSHTFATAKSNGIKRSATASPAGGQPKPKKPKPAPRQSRFGNFRLEWLAYYSVHSCPGCPAWHASVPPASHRLASLV